MYARQILKTISEKVVVMINKDWGGGILDFVGVTTVMRGHIAPKSQVPPIKENLFLYVSLNMRV